MTILLLPLNSYSCLTALVMTSCTMVNRSDDDGHLCLTIQGDIFKYFTINYDSF